MSTGAARLAEPARLAAVHSKAPLCSALAEVMVRMLERSPMGTTSTPASPVKGRPRKLHEMLTGRSPLDTWQLSCTLSPMFTSSSNPNGRMCGSTGETGRLSYHASEPMRDLEL